jgi:4a-hydroxytetrahydrobiopterin dehydratase
LPLDEKEARKMLTEVPGWNLSADATTIYRDYTFSNFKKALKFVNQVGEVAEAEQHHPDLKLGWGYVHISLQTHAIKGLHENDFILAAKINAIA